MVLSQFTKVGITIDKNYVPGFFAKDPLVNIHPQALKVLNNALIFYKVKYFYSDGATKRNSARFINW